MKYFYITKNLHGVQKKKTTKSFKISYYNLRKMILLVRCFQNLFREMFIHFMFWKIFYACICSTVDIR